MEQTADAPTGLVAKVFQDKLAWWVFFVSCIGIFIAASFSYFGAADAATKATNSREIFSALIPLFSTWVGTILAFYFSRANFEAANKAVGDANRAVGQALDKLTPDERLQRTSVGQVMKNRKAIQGIKLSPTKDETKTFISEIRELIDKGFSRVIIFSESDAVKYVIPDAVFNKFVADSALGATPVDPANTTLATLLATKLGDKDYKLAATRFAVVKADATLKDARDAMVAVADAKDAFVTKTGKVEEPVEGWLTNTDIMKDL
jgi:hypothetical protein